ncbi:hypothetical protein BSK66_27780 [Paenibacillus odorifer]|uniref:MobQ family relaxase n=1 Tax=Paenibacillus TaxID=44249 RepID=UPI0003E23FFC|nr:MULTISPECIES: MobQ family relaxase [Paenibacillus]ETT61276.1 conjugation protein [Paenibacillus sp. FSL H8-237]OMD13758.1 hypothetical protein BJP47_24330 [Paenibacillus odorifer]OME48988.1 hypothetical protein BSK66_27780 [Paenibacillus odorifer]
MAIYHFAMQISSRSAGKSSVAMAAYRSGERLTDDRTGEIKQYRPRAIEPETAILAPKHAPEWVYNRQRLWNEVELIEKQSNAQLCREFNIALPVELSKEQQQILVAKFVQEQFVDRGMVADIGIHRDDPGNPHFHVMLTMRPFNEDGTWGNKSRKVYVLDEQGEKIKLKSGNYKTYKERTTNWDEKETLTKWREEWANYANKSLEQAGFSTRIDHRSLEEQGITDRMPTIHEGVIVNSMELKGKITERGDINRSVKEHNAIVVSLNDYRKEKESIEQQNGLLRPEERKIIRQAKAIIQNTLNLDSVQEGLDSLSMRESGLHQQIDQMLKQEVLFNNAEGLLDLIKSLQSDLEGPRVINKEGKLRHTRIENEIAKARDTLQKLGFSTNEEQFKSRKAKVLTYHNDEMTKIKQAREQIAEKQKILRRSEKILLKQEVQILAQQFSDSPGSAKLQYSEVKAIREMNEHMGKMSLKDLRSTFNKLSEKMNALIKAKEQFIKNAERLRVGEQWLAKYEKQLQEIRKLFLSSKVKQQLKEDIAVSSKMLKQHGIVDRKDYNNQVLIHNQDSSQIQKIDEQIHDLQPGVNVLQGAVRALRAAEQRNTADQQRNHWANKQRNVIRTQENDRDLER